MPSRNPGRHPFAGRTPTPSLLSGRDRVVLLSLLLLLASRLVIAGLIVPAWQHPDEPQHMDHIATMIKQGGWARPTQVDPAASREIVESMAKHRWWSYYGSVPPPELMPTVAATGVGTTLQMPRGYYLFATAILRTLRVTRTLDQYWTLRVVSALVSVVAVFVIWLGTRLAFDTYAAHGTVALLSLHPQFALVSTAVSPDVLVNLCGALLWWQAARALGGFGCYSAGIISAITALVALLTKRMGLPLVAMAAVVIVLAFAGHRRPRLEWKWYMVVAGVLLAAPVALLILTPDLSDAVRYGARLLGGRDPGVPPAHLSLGRFSSGLLQSAWLNAGWLTVPAPPGWYLVASCVSAVALIAVTGLFTPESWQWPKLATGVAVAFVVIQTAAIYGTYYRADLGAQGRYLLPIAGPFFALVWAGGTRYWPRRYAGAPAVVLFATMVLLDVCSWTRVLVPGFSR